MDDNASPLLYQRRLRTELLTARLKKELTQQQVADAMEWSLSKVNRIEKAKSGISTNDLKALLRLYEITDEEQTEELVAMARAARQTPWWRRRYSEVASKELLDLIDYESASSSISQFETIFVPGILQTEDYASAILHVFHGDKYAPERLAALVDLRTRRRELLTRRDTKFSLVMDESVIHRVVGGPSVMRQQLETLVASAELPNVTIRIVPFTVGSYPGMKGSFELVEFDDMPDENIVFVEEQSGSFFDEDPGVTGNYLETFRRITERSLKPTDSVRRLREAADATA